MDGGASRGSSFTLFHEPSGRRNSKLLAGAVGCTVSVGLHVTQKERMCTLFSFFTFSLSHFGKCTFKCISKLSGWLLLFRSLWCKTELLLLRTAGRAYSPHIWLLLHTSHKYSRYSCYYGVAFILQIGVFLLQTFFRNKRVVEADGLVRSQGKIMALPVFFFPIYEAVCTQSKASSTSLCIKFAYYTLQMPLIC